jgi:hypothetical protein
MIQIFCSITLHAQEPGEPAKPGENTTPAEPAEPAKPDVQFPILQEKDFELFLYYLEHPYVDKDAFYKENNITEEYFTLVVGKIMGNIGALVAGAPEKLTEAYGPTARFNDEEMELFFKYAERIGDTGIFR